MASGAAGIDRWAAAIRYRMVNDPGRQDLDDHILCNGFLFLDEYLEDILLGARTEPIIELTKTPGRRKDASKKVRAATAASVKPPSFQSPDKENIPIAKSIAITEKKPTSFQRALLKASKENNPLDSPIEASLPASRPTGPIIHDKEISYRIPEDPNNPDGPMATVTVPYDPEGDEDDDTQAFPPAFDRTFNDSEATSTASSFPIDPYARDYETHELPQVVAEHSSQPERVAPPNSPHAPVLTRKASVPVFPSLPVPSPLRKSIRDSSAGGPASSNARPSTTGGHISGTQTSWLNKARDVTAKRTSTVSGVKRKSTELNGELDYTAPEGHTRAAKIPKMNVEDGVSAVLSNTEKPTGKLTIQPFRAIVPSQAKELSVPHAAPPPDGNSEGMMHMLKRTVEGLGTRVGKSMGKSLGNAAATAAAAEAKAAAEARLAQREAKGSDGSRQHRLSVSDLVGAYEGGGISKGKGPEFPVTQTKPLSPIVSSAPLEARISVSTTPPDSPPVTRQPIQIPSSLGSATYAIPKFTVQRDVSQELSFALPESQPFSEVGWAHSSRDFALHDEPASLGAEQEQSLAPADTRDQLPGAFEADDPDVERSDAPLEEDMESEVNEELRFAHSLDATESKLNAGSSQENLSTSIQTGFVAQASTLLSKVMGSSVGNALGGSKRGKAEPVKSIQLAAAAAKKQQEEADKKAARLKEMDKRRAAIASKKADQEAAEKNKQQGERRKREREEGTEKKATRTTVKRVEEETIKKRKVFVEIEKPEIKKPKEKKDLGTSRIGKPVLNTSLSQSQIASASTSKPFKQPALPASASQPSIKLVGSSQGESKSVTTLPKAGSNRIKGKAQANGLEDICQPSQALQAQMQARVQAQILQAKQDEPLVPSESIELPDINSEYSNSDDEDRPRTFDPPDWAQSPVLGLALQSQSRLNPDDIFGPVKPLRMEEIFMTRHSRFRARTSSANWAGTDELTADEQQAYAKRMGYLD